MAKNQLYTDYSRMKLPNLENWSSGELSKSAKIWHKSIFNVKNHPNLSDFFFIEEYEFRSFLLLIFFNNINLFHFCMTSRDSATMIPNLWTIMDIHGFLWTFLDDYRQFRKKCLPRIATTSSSCMTSREPATIKQRLSMLSPVW